MEKAEDNGNIKVLGQQTPAPAAETDPNNADPNGSAEKPKEQEKNQEADNIKVLGGDKSKEEKPKEEAKKEKEEAKPDNENKDPNEDGKSKSEKPSDEEDKPKAFAVDFGGEEKKEEKPKEPTEDKREAVSVSEESVLQYLQTEFPDVFADVKSLNELSKKEELPEAVVAFNKFHKETGRGIKDFYNLQRDWSKEEKDSTILEYYKMTNEGLSEDDIQVQMDLITVTDDHEVNLSPEELAKRKLDYKKEYNKALKFMQAKSKEYETPLESKQVEQKQPQLTEEQIAERYQPYWNARDKSLEELKEFKFSIGIGEVNVPINEEMKKAISERMETDQAFFQPWIKDGKIDTNEAVQDMLWSIPSIRKQLLADIAKQTNALTIEDYSKKSRNVDLDKVPKKAKEVARKGGVQRVSGAPENTMGQPLIPAKN